MFKKTLLFVFLISSIVSCNKNDKVTLVSSTGRINHVLIVIKNSDWQGKIGDALRDIITQPLPGLPQEEQQFSINHVAPEAFSQLFKSSRNILFIGFDNETKFYTNKNIYADPQITLSVLGKNEQNIIDNINEHRKEIISIFKKNDLKIYQQKLAQDLWNPKNIETLNKLGFTLKIPNQYVKVEDNGEFLWYRNDYTKGQMNILAYTIPAKSSNDLNIDHIIQIRDSIGKKYIPGQFDNTYMATEPKFKPITKELKFHGLDAIELRGLWIVENDFMGGPFLSYTIYDKKNNRLIILEGFTYSPSTKKRDFVFELESILKTFQIK
jgi:hypothetical protein